MRQDVLLSTLVEDGEVPLGNPIAGDVVPDGTDLAAFLAFRAVIGNEEDRFSTMTLGLSAEESVMSDNGQCLMLLTLP